jgi:hypothetical protein
MDPTNSIVWARKNFIGYIDVMQGWFSAEVRSKISDLGVSRHFPAKICFPELKSTI